MFIILVGVDSPRISSQLLDTHPHSDPPAPSAHSYSELHESSPGAGPSSINSHIPTFSLAGSYRPVMDFTVPRIIVDENHDRLEDRGSTLIQAPCPGQWVHWVPGSVWDTYAYHQHERRTMAWTLEGINGEQVRLRAKECEGVLRTEDELNHGSCDSCRRLLTSESLARFMQQATGDALPHTAWIYLNHYQSGKLMVDMSKRIKRLELKVGIRHLCKHGQFMDYCKCRFEKRPQSLSA